MEFENGNKLKGYLSNEAKVHDIHSNYSYTYFFIRDFLSKLMQTNIDDFTVKGSIALLASNKHLIRPITDIDATSNLSLFDSAYLIEKTIQTEDRVKYKLRQKFVTTNDTINFKILCKFDTLEHMIKLDLKKENRGNVIIKEMPKIFAKDEVYNIKTLSLEEIVANKIYIILTQLRKNEFDGKEIRRFKDFYDLYKIIQNKNYDEELVRLYFIENVYTYGSIGSIDPLVSMLNAKFAIDNSAVFDLESKQFGFDKSVDLREIVDATKEEISRRTR